MNEDSPRDKSVLTPDVDPTAQARPVEPDAPRPNLERTGRAIGNPRTRSIGVTTLTVLAVLYTLYFARPFLLPLVFALLLSFLFGPVVRAMARLRIPPPFGSGLVVLALLGIVGLGGYELSGPVQSWAANAPQTLSAAQVKLRKLLRPLERASRTAEQVQSAAGAVGNGAAGERPREVVVRQTSLIARVFGTTQRFAASALEVIILLYFLLAGGDLFLQKLVKVLPTTGEKRKAVEIARMIESSVSTYLLTVAVVNVIEGAVVAVAMWLLGMPSPILWGALVAFFEFMPYLGALTMVLILGVTAITVFDSVGRALLVPAVFLIINVVQANFVSPIFVGHRLALNPVALLVGLTFFFWIWGIPGAFIAVPILATFKIFCDHIASLAAVGEFLGMRDEDERRSTVRGI
ncbi:AI-2E family transporter [Longimicrobium sp.]|uniref:AI-2E family transporter n=1 Tax=Longimicrobium sp. TaxID=2029185 RepID=UPI002BF331B1|nr:AI-2E family transporter [Longimicrobium sp.]HSU16546.1 AI-2E family transporter [Longimicrobium sp.]